MEVLFLDGNIRCLKVSLCVKCVHKYNMLKMWVFFLSNIIGTITYNNKMKLKLLFFWGGKLLDIMFEDTRVLYVN